MIELRGVYKTFGDSAPILAGVDLCVSKGETLVILGRSGTGKSVTLKHIIGLLKPDRGQVLVFGQDLASLSAKQLKETRRRVGYLFQDGALLNWLNLADNVALPLRENYRLSKAEIQQRVHQALATVELQDASTKLPGEISGGMRKRAGLARALVAGPDVILYDEPTSGLDPISSSIINRLVVNLKNTLGVTQIVVTHDMSSAFTIADRIVLLHDGSIIAEGTPAELRDSKHPGVDQFVQGKIDGPLSRRATKSRPLD
ncbi:MAG: ABC transporter ATP-binding protein [Planctomycetota bacterium]